MDGVQIGIGCLLVGILVIIGLSFAAIITNEIETIELEITDVIIIDNYEHGSLIKVTFENNESKNIFIQDNIDLTVDSKLILVIEKNCFDSDYRLSRVIKVPDGENP